MYITPDRRRDIVDAVRNQHPGMQDEPATALVLLVVSMLAKGARPRRATKAEAKARLDRVVALMRTTKYPLSQIAEMEGLSQSRVSQMIAVARADGLEIPERTSGLRTINMEARAKVLAMGTAGATQEEMALAIGVRGVSAVQILQASLRREGETVPHMGEVSQWRRKLHEAKREVDSAARALLTLGRSPSMRGHLEDRLDASQAKFDALAANKPEGVLTMPKNI
jgi:hypothetical protein